jgi:hypothetical protein
MRLSADPMASMTEKPLCPQCAGSGWICEDHPDRAWTACNCGGAGMRCPCCNKSAGPDDPPDVSRLCFALISGGEHVGNVPDNEAEYYLRCPLCGQVYDAGDPDAELAHDDPLPLRIEVSPR